MSIGSSSKILSSLGVSFVKKLSTCKDCAPLRKSSMFISSLLIAWGDGDVSLSMKEERSISPSEKSSRETSSVFGCSALSFSSKKAERSISPSENASRDTSSAAVSKFSWFMKFSVCISASCISVVSMMGSSMGSPSKSIASSSISRILLSSGMLS